MKLTKKLLIIAAIGLAFGSLGYSLNAMTMSACNDECLADYAAQRQACADMNATWPDILQCYNDAKDARDLCIASCP